MSIETLLHESATYPLWETIGEVQHPTRARHHRMILMRHTLTGLYACDDLGAIVSVPQRWARTEALARA